MECHLHATELELLLLCADSRQAVLRNYRLNHAPQQRTVVAGAPAPSEDAAHQAPIAHRSHRVTRRGTGAARARVTEKTGRMSIE